MDIYFIRHGQTGWNIVGEIQGNTDIPLNEMGRRQVQYLADGIKSRPVAGIFSSTLGRALEMAGVADAAQRVVIEPIDGLEEVGFGRQRDMSWDGIVAQYLEEYRRWRLNPVEVSPPGDKLQGEVWLRCKKAVDTILSRAAETKDDIAVVSHRATLAYIIQYLMREHPLEEELIVHNTSITTATYGLLTDDFVLVDMNNTEHLH